MEYTIDKNIAIPKSFADRRLSEWTVFRESMEVGDSVLFPSREVANNLVSSLNRTANFKAKTRKVDATGSIRVWKALKEGTEDLDQEYEKLLLEQEDKDEYQVNT